MFGAEGIDSALDAVPLPFGLEKNAAAFSESGSRSNVSTATFTTVVNFMPRASARRFAFACAARLIWQVVGVFDFDMDNSMASSSARVKRESDRKQTLFSVDNLTDTLPAMEQDHAEKATIGIQVPKRARDALDRLKRLGPSPSRPS